MHYSPNFNNLWLTDSIPQIKQRKKWNSWVDNDTISKIKSLKETLYPWFFLKQFKKNDRDRMENEELITSLIYLEHSTLYPDHTKSLDIFQKSERINTRISSKAHISTLLQKVTEKNGIKKDEFLKAIKNIKSFCKKLKYVLLDCDKTCEELPVFLKNELDEIFKVGKEPRYFKRTLQDFYVTWYFLRSLNFEMVKHKRIEIKKDIKDMFKYFKNIPESEWNNNLGLEKFHQMFSHFKEKYSTDKRKIKLSEEEKLQLIREQGNKSSITKAPIFLGDDIEVDHMTAIAIGGKDEKENLGIAHGDENRKKRTKT